MKANKYIPSLFLFLFVFSMAASGQSLIAVVDYMKLNPNFDGDYVEVEKSWKKIHEARQAEGILHSWTLYRVMFTGVDSPYDYVTVNFYTDMGKLENSFPQEIIQKAYPDMKDDEIEKMMQKTGASRELLKSEVFFQRLVTDTANQGKFIVVNRMNVVNVTGPEYVQMEREIYKPLHDESVRMGLRSGWSVWNKWPGDYRDFNFVTVDSYKSLSQMVSNNQPLFKSVHPDKDPLQVEKDTDRIRDWVSAEIWQYVDGVPPVETGQ